MSETCVEREMPRYKSHKTVWALKIDSIAFHADGSAMIIPAEPGYASFPVDRAYVNDHKPKAGGYYVVSSGGYKSYSPAGSFEIGYTLQS